MTITISYEKGTNPVLVAACDWAVEKRMAVSLVNGCMRLETNEFSDFLACVWHGFAVTSMGSHGWAMRRRYECVVKMPSGSCYHIWVMLDEDGKGIYYGSIDID